MLDLRVFRKMRRKTRISQIDILNAYNYYLQKKYNRIRALLKFKRFIEIRQASTTLNVPRLATNFERVSLCARLAKRISNILIPAPQNFLLLRPPPSPPLPIHPNPPHHLSHPPLTIPSSHGGDGADIVTVSKEHNCDLRKRRCSQS